MSLAYMLSVVADYLRERQSISGYVMSQAEPEAMRIWTYHFSAAHGATNLRIVVGTSIIDLICRYAIAIVRMKPLCATHAGSNK